MTIKRGREGKGGDVGRPANNKGWHVTTADCSRVHACLPVQSQGCRAKAFSQSARVAFQTEGVSLSLSWVNAPFSANGLTDQ